MADQRNVESRVVSSTPMHTEHTERVEVHREPIAAGVYQNPPAAAPVRRISWGAILAGVVIVLVTQLLLSLLGIGIGASTINPTTEANPASGLGTGAVIWFIVSSLIALFAGGWVAGRLAGIPRNTDSMLHGILTWGLSTLLIFYLLTSTIGSLIGGTFNVIGSALSAAARGVAAAAPAVAGAVSDQVQQSGVDMGDIRREIQTLLRQTGQPELQPGAIANQANRAGQAVENAAGAAAADPANSDAALDAVLDRIARSGAATINAADRDALVNIIMARTGASRPQAEQTVNSYAQTYQQARQRLGQARDQAGQTAREVGEQAASGVSKAAISAFFALLVSLLAAAAGGWLATPRDLATRNAAARG